MINNYIKNLLDNYNISDNTEDFIKFLFTYENNEFILKNIDNSIVYFSDKENIKDIYITYKTREKLYLFEYLKKDNNIKILLEEEIKNFNLNIHNSNNPEESFNYNFILKNIAYRNYFFKTNSANLSISKFDFFPGLLEGVYIKKDDKHIKKLMDKKLSLDELFKSKIKRITQENEENLNDENKEKIAKKLVNKLLEKIVEDKTTEQFKIKKDFLLGKKTEIYEKIIGYYKKSINNINMIKNNETFKINELSETKNQIIQSLKTFFQNGGRTGTKKDFKIELNSIIYSINYLKNLNEEANLIKNFIKNDLNKKLDISYLYPRINDNCGEENLNLINNIIKFSKTLKSDVDNYKSIIYLYYKYININTKETVYPDFLRFTFIETYNYLTKKPLLSPFLIKDQNIYLDININKYLILKILRDGNNLFDKKLEIKENIYKDKNLNLYYKINANNYEILDFEIMDNIFVDNKKMFESLEVENGVLNTKELTINNIIYKLLDYFKKFRLEGITKKIKLLNDNLKEENLVISENENLKKLYNLIKINFLLINKTILMSIEKEQENKKTFLLEKEYYNFIVFLTSLEYNIKNKRNEKMNSKTKFLKRIEILKRILKKVIVEKEVIDFKVVEEKEIYEKDIDKLIDGKLIKIDKNTLLFFTGIIIKYLLNTKNVNSINFSEIDLYIKQIIKTRDILKVINKLVRTSGKNENMAGFHNEYLFLISKLSLTFNDLENNKLKNEEITYLMLGITFPKSDFYKLLKNEE